MGSDMKASGKRAGKPSRKRRVLRVILVGLIVVLLFGAWWGIRRYRLAKAAEQLLLLLEQDDENGAINLVKKYPRLVHVRIIMQTQHESWGDYLARILKGDISLRRREIGCSTYVLNEPTFLHMASNKNCSRLAQALIAAKADVNAADDCGHTPLHFVESVDMAKLLIASGSDVHRRNNWGNTPLAYAVGPVAEVFLAAGADVNALNDWGRTPLHLAANAGRVEAVKLLIAHGAGINTQDNYNATPLHGAVCNYGEMTYNHEHSA